MICVTYSVNNSVYLCLAEYVYHHANSKMMFVDFFCDTTDRHKWGENQSLPLSYRICHESSVCSDSVPYYKSTKEHYGLSQLFFSAYWLHTMTSSNGNISRVTGPLWREFTGHRWIPPIKASDAELWFFYLRLNKRMSKYSIRLWF